MPTGIVNNKNNKRKTYHSNKGGNKRFKRGKSKKYVHFTSCVVISFIFFKVLLKMIYWCWELLFSILIVGLMY